MLEQFGWAFGTETDTGVTSEKSFPGHPWSILLRSGRYKYIRWLMEGEYEELYDLEDDPDEQVNLARKPEHQDRLREFRKKLERELERTDAGMAGRLPVPRPWN